MEAGRVATINYGAGAGQKVIIVDIVDKNRVQIVFPGDKFKRVLYPIRRLDLSNHKVKILRGARNATVKKAIAEYKLDEKWKNSSTFKRQEVKAKRAALNDLDRFKVMINRKNRSYKVRQIAKKIAKK